ncbi:MAG: hypothetical protein NVS3B18_09010 [Candidatus Dormibacteria bacterium]
MPPEGVLTRRYRVPQLDRRSPVPLWAQLLEALRGRMAAAEFADHFPSEQWLMTEYNVSRHTVREALRRLRSEGRVLAHRGRASRVNPVHEQPLGALWSLFRAVEARGHAQRSVVLALDERRDAAAAANLELPADSPLIHLERLRQLDGEPLAWDRAWLPADLARPLLGADFRRTALYDELATRCAVVLEAGSETVEAQVPGRDVRRRLDLGPGVAVYAISRLAVHRGRRVEWRQSVVRADRFSLLVAWQPEDPRRVEMSGALTAAHAGRERC